MLRYILLVLFCWVLIHFFAAFGVVLMLLYILLWFLFPTYTACIYCGLFKDPKKRDYLCNSSLPRHRHHPQTFGAMIVGVLLILLVTAGSLFFVYGEAELYTTFYPTQQIEIAKGEDVLGVAEEASTVREVRGEDFLGAVEEEASSFKRLFEIVDMINRYILDFWIR